MAKIKGWRRIKISDELLRAGAVDAEAIVRDGLATVGAAKINMFHVELESGKGQWWRVPITFAAFNEAADYIAALRAGGWFIASARARIC